MHCETIRLLACCRLPAGRIVNNTPTSRRKWGYSCATDPSFSLARDLERLNRLRNVTPLHLITSSVSRMKCDHGRSPSSNMGL